MGALQGLRGRQELVAAELGEVLAGGLQRSAEEITVYGPVGLPFQDLIAAWATYQKALSKKRGQSLCHLS